MAQLPRHGVGFRLWGLGWKEHQLRETRLNKRLPARLGLNSQKSYAKPKEGLESKAKETTTREYKTDSA